MLILADFATEMTDLTKSLKNLPWKTLLLAIVLLAAGIIVVRILMRIIDRLLRRTRLDGSLHRFLKTILRLVLYIALLLSVISFLGIDVTSLVALLSVVTLAISLAVQNVLSNVAGGLMLMGAKPFKKGDFVCIDGEEGTIDEIGTIYTRYHTMDNRSVLVPNSTMSTATIENYSALGTRRVEMVVGASYTSDPLKVMEALRKAALRCEPLEGEEIISEFREFGDSAITYHVCLWIPAARIIQTRYDLRRYVWEEFKAAGVEMTYPHLNVHIAK